MADEIHNTPSPDKSSSPMTKSDQNHPIWRLLDFVIIAIVVIVFSYTSASNFDETEAEMIRNILIAFGIYEGSKSLIAKKGS